MESYKMTMDEIKDYIKDYFIEHDCQIFEEVPLEPEFLDGTAIRYQYFGDHMFDVYKYDLSHCLFLKRTAVFGHVGCAFCKTSFGF